MRCIVGLGNPGQRYQNTRHNSGFMVVDLLVSRYRLRWDTGPGHALIARASEGPWGEGFFVAKPLVYMNESGRAFVSLCTEYLIYPWEFIVVHDDMDIPFGAIRLKRNGGPGGHRGVESVIASLGTDEFVRVKVGIGRPPDGIDPAEYVLLPFGEEPETVENVLNRAADACIDVLTLGLERAMNLHNRQMTATGPDARDGGSGRSKDLGRV